MAKAEKENAAVKTTTVTIKPPNLVRAAFKIRGTAPLVIHRFSTKVADEMAQKMAAGTTAGSKGKKVRHRVYVSLTTDRKRRGGGYRLTTTVLSDAEMRRQLLRDALADLRVFEDKYRHLKELARIFAVIRVVRKRVKKIAA